MPGKRSATAGGLNARKAAQRDVRAARNAKRAAHMDVRGEDTFHPVSSPRVLRPTVSRRTRARPLEQPQRLLLLLLCPPRRSIITPPFTRLNGSPIPFRVAYSQPRFGRWSQWEGTVGAWSIGSRAAFAENGLCALAGSLPIGVGRCYTQVAPHIAVNPRVAVRVRSSDLGPGHPVL